MTYMITWQEGTQVKTKRFEADGFYDRGDRAWDIFRGALLIAHLENVISVIVNEKYNKG